MGETGEGWKPTQSASMSQSTPVSNGGSVLWGNLGDCVEITSKLSHSGADEAEIVICHLWFLIVEGYCKGLKAVAFSACLVGRSEAESVVGKKPAISIWAW